MVRRHRTAARRRLVPAALLLLPLVALADVRVLIAFDAAGHRVHRVTRTGDALDKLRGGVDPTAGSASIPRAGDAVLSWLAADGTVLAIERVRDPRRGHAPAPGGDAATLSPGTPVALASGGWLARGPDAARTLVVRLPEVAVPALAAEQWRLELDEEGAPSR